MKTVTLFRHAKSAGRDDPDIADFDRPLAERGIKVAPKMGKAMRKRKLKPGLILCSPSVRTRQTLTLAEAEAWDRQPEVRFDERIYDASVQTLLKLLRGLPDELSHIMIVGHNPGLQDLAVALTPRANPARAPFEEKLPTAALVCFDFDTERWRNIKPGTGQLRLFLTPNML
jgi:phosphohistidine phosphatase